VMDFMDEVDAAVDRADRQLYLTEQDRILAEWRPSRCRRRNGMPSRAASTGGVTG
jgi:hypothetical protein